MKTFNQFNESLRDKMLPKSDEEIRISIDKMPNWKKSYYIANKGLERLFTDEELKEYEDAMPRPDNIGGWYMLTLDDKTYDVIMQHGSPDSIIVFEHDSYEKINGQRYWKLAPYEIWDDIEEIMLYNL